MSVIQLKYNKDTIISISNLNKTITIMSSDDVNLHFLLNLSERLKFDKKVDFIEVVAYKILIK